MKLVLDTDVSPGILQHGVIREFLSLLPGDLPSAHVRTNPLDHIVFDWNNDHCGVVAAISSRREVRYAVHVSGGPNFTGRFLMAKALHPDLLLGLMRLRG